MAEQSSGRGGDGRFIAGNQLGRGRPRRAIESDYLRALSTEVPLETWRSIVRGAVAAAVAGDDKSRAWLARYLLGDQQPHSLKRLAAQDIRGVDAESEILDEVKSQDTCESLRFDFGRGVKFTM